jgi:hypothetical protein
MEKIGMKYIGLTDLHYNATLALYHMERADWQRSADFYRLTP